MGWKDRDYNRGREAAGEFFSNPASILSMAVPVGRWFGSRVTLHFWLLLVFVFILIGQIKMGNFLGGVAACALLTAVALAHDLGHRTAARRVGGQLEEFVLWPFGGLNLPSLPPTPSALFIGSAGGIAVNALLAIGCGVALASTGRLVPLPLTLNPLAWISFSIGWPEMAVVQFRYDVSASILNQLFIFNLGMLLANLLPYYNWFDGGNLWQSILQPIAGAYRAVAITCIAGIVIAVPMFVVSLLGLDFFGLILWALLFSAAYVRYRDLRAAGPGMIEAELGWAVGGGEDERPRRSWWRRKSDRASATRRRAEEVKLDAILAKIQRSGMDSLSWTEKRALKKATDRKRASESSRTR